jgi:hypothetical protein
MERRHHKDSNVLAKQKKKNASSKIINKSGFNNISTRNTKTPTPIEYNTGGPNDNPEIRCINIDR